MRTAKELRLLNYLRLAKQYRFVKDFCAEIDIKPSYHTQIVAPEGKGIGDALARRIEERLNLPRGYMDKDHAETKDTVISKGAALAAVIDDLPESIAENLKRLVFSIALEINKKG
jgi:hypothetical protein